MFDSPPKEREAVSWGYVVLWSGIIFATIPFVRAAVKFVGDRWGIGTFTYAVAACILLATTIALYKTRKSWTLSSILTLLGLAAALIYLTFGLAGGSAVEAMHYVQYGTLSFLLFRAFSHRVRDYSIYVAATLVGTIVGMLDETIQWLTPRRYFDLRDIWLNLTAVAFVQIALAAGIRPKMIAGLPGWDSLRRLCTLGVVALGYLALCLQNTPERISWYATNIPGLGFIDPDRSIMVEYGYMHGDASTGFFRSRLTLDELGQPPAARTEEGTHILDLYAELETYEAFRELYSPVADPYLHEIRIHLLWRDRHLGLAGKAETEDAIARHLTTAHWENRILQTYFGEVLQGSSYVWTAEEEATAAAGANMSDPFVSRVSEHLVTGYTARQLGFLSLAGIGALMLGAFLCRRLSRRGEA